ncbi:MAG TPA: DUF4157 domain-containing protein [Pyrinomonadaceae bacterium]|jgi:hypothetical protein
MRTYWFSPNSENTQIRRKAEVGILSVTPKARAGNSTLEPILQRTASCACGGGCPRCQKEALHSSIQFKLAISAPGDPYEQEAERVADEVLRMTEPNNTARVTFSGGISNPRPFTEDSAVTRVIQRQAKPPETKDLSGDPISLSSKIVNPGKSTWSLVTDSVPQNAGRLASAIRPNTDFSDYSGWQLEQKVRIPEYVRDDAAGVDIELKATWEHSGVPIKGGTGRYVGPTGIVVEVAKLDAPTIVNIKVDSAKAGFDLWDNVAQLTFDLSVTIKSSAVSKNYHRSITFSGGGGWSEEPVTKLAQEKSLAQASDPSAISILQADNSPEEVQRKCGEPSEGEPLSHFQSLNHATSAVEKVLHLENGKPLDNPIRTFMESRFGHDFSGVRIHTDDSAVLSAETINARSYTVGRDIVFGASQYAPETFAGRHLLAHELAHVMQQARPDSAPKRFIQRQGGSVKEMAEALKKEWHKKKIEVEAAEKAAIPVGATSLPPNVEREVKWHLKNSNRQEALNALVDHLVSAGKIKRDYLYEKKMFYDAALQFKEGQAEAKGTGPNSILVKISIGTAAYDPPIEGDPTKHAGPNISWLYSSVLHEYQHALQIQGPGGDLTKIADVDERWTKKTIRDIEAYAVEIKEASNTGLDKKPELMEDIWRRLHKDNWLKVKSMLENAKVQAILTKAEKERLNKLYQDAYSTAKTIVGKPLGYAPFKLL